MFAAALAFASLTVASSADLLSTIQGDPRLVTLSAAIKAAGIESTLTGTGPFTVFAPTNSAFNREPWYDYKLKYLLDPSHKDALTSLLEYHLVSGAVKSSELSVGESLTTVEGQSLTVGNNGTNVVIGKCFFLVLNLSIVVHLNK